MSNHITKNLLTLYWDAVLGEIQGQTFYMFGHQPDFPPPPFPCHLWSNNIKIKNHQLFGGNWTVWLWNIHIPTFPDRWLDTTQLTLSWFNDHQAMISWYSLEGYFEDPPSLFHPNMAKRYYAAMTTAKNLMCHTDLYQAYKGLTIQNMIYLQKTMMV